jgi:hypothetical protein
MPTFRIYLKDLVSTRPVNPNDPLAGAMPDSSSYWGEGTMYVLGLGLKRWYDAICNPTVEPGGTADLHSVHGDSLKNLAPKAKPTDPDVLVDPGTYQSARVMKPKKPYPATRYTESDFWWDRPASDVTGDAVLIYFLRTSSDSLIVKREAGMAGSLGGGGTTRRIGTGTVSEVYVESLLQGGTIGNMQTLINLAFHESMHNKLQAGKELHADGGLAADMNWPGDTLNVTNIRKMRAALETPVIQDTQYLSLKYV